MLKRPLKTEKSKKGQIEQGIASRETLLRRLTLNKKPESKLGNNGKEDDCG